jgi:excisionase family DNA binding protein
MSLPELYTIEDAAKWLKVSPEAVECEINSGRIAAFKIGGEWRIADTILRGLVETTLNRESKSVEPIWEPNFSLSQSAEFDYKWPSDYVEHFINVHEGQFKVGDELFSAKTGECKREAYGRERKRIVIFFNDYPNTEFVETDNPADHFFTFLPGNTNPRQHLRPGETIDRKWQSFTICEISEVVDGPRTGNGLGIVLPYDDLVNMVRFARLKAYLRWGW